MKRALILLFTLIICASFVNFAACGGETEKEKKELPTTLKILYQGDSITDSSRSREDLTDLGTGYAYIVSASLSATYKDRIEMEFINRAASGARLIRTWNGVSNYEDEFYQYNADIATILIGYNDIMGQGVVPLDEDYEEAYDRLLQGLKERGTYAICIAPYYINADVNDYVQEQFESKSEIVKKLANKYKFGYIDMKPSMDAALAKGAERMELFGDLIHPICAANKIIAGLVTDAIRTYIDSEYESDGNVGKYERVSVESDNPKDLTNSRFYIYSTLGEAHYDTTTFLNDRMSSGQSLKVVRGTDNGTYTQVALLFEDGKKPNLSNGYLELDVKLENAVKWMSFTAFGTVVNNTDSKSSEYGVDLSNRNIVSDMGNGWYHIKVSLSDWVSRGASNQTILSSAKQLVIAMSKGANQQQKQSAGINPQRNSIVWIDNLCVNPA